LQSTLRARGRPARQTDSRHLLWKRGL